MIAISYWASIIFQDRERCLGVIEREFKANYEKCYPLGKDKSEPEVTSAIALSSAVEIEAEIFMVGLKRMWFFEI